MQFSIWAYPWDIADLGFETVYSDVRDRAGLNTISIAASYHAGKFVQPRSPSRKVYYPQDGAIYFRPTEALWQGREIRPLLADHVSENGDMLAQLAADRKAQGLAVHCWTVCLHNTRLGMAHPAHVTRNAFGDANLFSLCPSSPAVQDYAATLVADMTATYRPDMVELETPGFMGFDHGYHHEKDNLPLAASEAFLLSLCFCGHCMSAAAADGIDAHAARQTVRRLVCEACERETPLEPFPDFVTEGIDAFRDQPELQAYCLWRSKPVTALVARIRAQAHPDSRVVVISGVEPWREGLDLAAAGAACDGILLCVYGIEPAGVARHVALVRESLGAGKYLGAGFRLSFPETPGAAQLAVQVESARAAGANGLHFYNYGLIPQARLDWIAEAIRSLPSS